MTTTYERHIVFYSIFITSFKGALLGIFMAILIVLMQALNPLCTMTIVLDTSFPA